MGNIGDQITTVIGVGVYVLCRVYVVIFGSESVCIMTVCTCDHIHLCEKWTDFGVVEVNVCRVLFFGCYKVLSLDSKLYTISVY